MTYEFVEYADRDMLTLALANRIAGELRTALSQRDMATLAVPGGTSPGPVFDDLCAVDLEWDRVNVMLTDERWVPETSDRSNTRLLRDRLLTNKAASANLLPLYADYPTPEEGLGALAEGIKAQLPLSVVLLGMGADMHTASIFPEADKLDEALSPGAPVLLPMRAPGAPEPRITLSAEALDGAMAKHILIFGAEKRAALDNAKGKTPKDAPINAVLNGATVHWAE